MPFLFFCFSACARGRGIVQPDEDSIDSCVCESVISPHLPTKSSRVRWEWILLDGQGIQGRCSRNHNNRSWFSKRFEHSSRMTSVAALSSRAPILPENSEDSLWYTMGEVSGCHRSHLSGYQPPTAPMPLSLPSCYPHCTRGYYPATATSLVPGQQL